MLAGTDFHRENLPKHCLGEMSDKNYDCVRMESLDFTRGFPYGTDLATVAIGKGCGHALPASIQGARRFRMWLDWAPATRLWGGRYRHQVRDVGPRASAR